MMKKSSAKMGGLGILKTSTKKLGGGDAGEPATKTALNNREEHNSVKIEGGAAPKRNDRPGRKYGGRVGADKSPMSSGARPSSSCD